jgi:hypothetical protein
MGLLALIKRVIEYLANAILDNLRSVDRDRMTEPKWKESNIIEPVKMVRMLVGIGCADLAVYRSTGCLGAIP